MLRMKHLRIEISCENQHIGHFCPQGSKYQQLVINITTKDSYCFYPAITFLQIYLFVRIFNLPCQSMKVIQLPWTQIQGRWIVQIDNRKVLSPFVRLTILIFILFLDGLQVGIQAFQIEHVFYFTSTRNDGLRVHVVFFSKRVTERFVEAM